MNIGQLRQGDILLAPVDIEPAHLARIKSEVILALGEMTGHAHRLLADRVLVWDADDQTYIRVEGDKPGSIVHEDHDPVPAAVVAPNQTYRVIRQQEWNLSGEWRQVQD